MSVSEESTKRICTSSPIYFPVDEDPGQSGEESGEDRSSTETETQYHPLFNDVILRNVFDHVRRSDLLACRGVCRKWNVATLPFTRLAFDITVYKNKDNTTLPSSDGVNGIYSKSDLNDSAKEHSHTVQNFVELLSSNTLGIPFGKFKLGVFSTTDGDGQKFIELCGNTIQEISFLYEHYKTEDVLELLKSSPTLKTFELPLRISSQPGSNLNLIRGGVSRLSHLKHISIDFFQEPKYLSPSLVEEILSAAPNVSKFTLNESLEHKPEGNYRSLDVLRLIVKLGRVSSVQTLCLSGVWRQHADILTARQNPFNLKKLECRLGVDLKLITFFKNTLVDLSVSWTDINTFMRFPRMPHLKKISLGFISILNTRCANLEKIFPVLEKLHFDGFLTVLEKHEEFFPDSNPCLTVKSLRLERFYLAINGFKHIQTIFPNLTELNLDYLDGPETLTHIWGQMTQLEILTLNGSIIKMDGDLDSMFTGISTQGFGEMKMSGVLSDLEGMTETLRRETIQNLKTQYSQGPSITSLTKLRSIKLGVYAYIGEPGNYEDRCLKYLTDLSLYFGLYPIKSLKHLVVKRCKFTNTGCKILEDDVGLESCEFEYAVDPPQSIYHWI